IAYASIGQSVTQQWKIGRFRIDSKKKKWQEVEPVDLSGLEGPEVCAPAVRYNPQNIETPFELYVQQWCFREGGTIHHAVSRDGIHFKASEKPVITLDMFPEEHKIKGIYDVSITDAFLNGVPCECMTYTGIRAVGDGDVYLSMRPKSSGSLNDWSP